MPDVFDKLGGGTATAEPDVFDRAAPQGDVFDKLLSRDVFDRAAEPKITFATGKHSMTPGLDLNVPFKNAVADAEQRLGRSVTHEEKSAIADRVGVSGRNPTPRQYQESQAVTNAGESASSFPRAVARGIHEAGARVLGTVAPETAASSEHAYAVEHPLADTLKTEAGRMVGTAVAGAAPVIAAPELAPEIMAAQGGVEGAGESRLQNQQKLESGVPVSPHQEAADAISKAIVGILSGYAGGKAFEATGAIKSVAGRIAANTGVGAGLGAAGQAGSNLAEGKDIFDKVGQAALTGGLQQGIMSAGGEVVGALANSSNAPASDQPTASDTARVGKTQEDATGEVIQEGNRTGSSASGLRSQVSPTDQASATSEVQPAQAGQREQVARPAGELSLPSDNPDPRTSTLAPEHIPLPTGNRGELPPSTPPVESARGQASIGESSGREGQRVIGAALDKVSQVPPKSSSTERIPPDAMGQTLSRPSDSEIPADRRLGASANMDSARASPDSTLSPPAVQSGIGQKSLFREAGPDELRRMIGGKRRSQNMPDTLYFSNTPDLALGQGKNKGILFEYDPKGISAEADASKPSATFAAKQGMSELVSTSHQLEDLKPNLRSITIKPDALVGTDSIARAHLDAKLNGLERGGWSRTINDDGSVTYYRPAQPKASPESVSVRRVIPEQRNHAQIMFEGKPRRASVTTEENESGGFKVKRIKLHDDNTGSYDVIDVPPEASHQFENSADAREAIFQHLEQKYPMPKELPAPPESVKPENTGEMFGSRRKGALAIPSWASIKGALGSFRRLRERFSEVEAKDSPDLAHGLTLSVQASPQAQTMERDFSRRAFGGDAKAYQDWYELGLHYRRELLNARGQPANNLPKLSAAEVQARLANPKIQKAIGLWNSEVKPTLEDIRVQRGLPMDPNASKVPFFLNLPSEMEPSTGGQTNASFGKAFSKPASGEGEYVNDPQEAVQRIIRGHLRTDATARLADAVKAISIPPASVVDPSGKRSPVSFQSPAKAQPFTAKYKGRIEKVAVVDLNEGKMGAQGPLPPDYHYVPERVAREINNLHRQSDDFDTWFDRAMRLPTRVALIGDVAPHTARVVASVGQRLAQAGRSAQDILPSWAGSSRRAVIRLTEMANSPLGQTMQLLVDRGGANRGAGYGVKPATSPLGKTLNIPHDLLMNPDTGVDPLARRVVADAHLRMLMGNDQMNTIESSLKSGTMAPPEAAKVIEKNIGPTEMLALGRRINTTLGFSNRQTRSELLNWAQRIFPFVSSESGMIPNEIVRLATRNVNPLAVGRSLSAGRYKQAIVQTAAMLGSGAIGTHLLMNGINYAASKLATGNGHFMHDNDEGHKTDVYVAPGWYWSNLDPGLARAERIMGLKNEANGEPADVGREMTNEVFSTLNNGIRLFFSGVTQKALYLNRKNELARARGILPDLLPIGDNTMNAVKYGESAWAGVLKDVASTAGIQLKESTKGESDYVERSRLERAKADAKKDGDSIGSGDESRLRQLHREQRQQIKQKSAAKSR